MATPPVSRSDRHPFAASLLFLSSKNGGSRPGAGSHDLSPAVIHDDARLSQKIARRMKRHGIPIMPHQDALARALPPDGDADDPKPFTVPFAAEVASPA